MADRIKLGSITGSAGQIDVFEEAALRTTFADGIQTTAVGSAVCRLDFYQGSSPVVASDKPIVSNRPGGPAEQRTIHLRVVMPTISMLQFCVQTLRQLQTVDMKTTLGKDVDAAVKLLNSIEVRE